MKNSLKIWLTAILIFGIACKNTKSKSDLQIAFTQDTLDVGYTYWWPESGPFIGSCGEELSLVFSGILRNLEGATEDAGPLYTSQKGIVEIEKVYKIKEIGENTYANQKFVAMDCFHKSVLAVSDTVLVFCYDYEDAYTIPGRKSILKIVSHEDPLVKSIRRYIDAGENPIELKQDIGLWATKDLGRALEKIILCKEEIETGHDLNDILENE